MNILIDKTFIFPFETRTCGSCYKEACNNSHDYIPNGYFVHYDKQKHTAWACCLSCALDYKNRIEGMEVLNSVNLK